MRFFTLINVPKIIFFILTGQGQIERTKLGLAVSWKRSVTKKGRLSSKWAL